MLLRVNFYTVQKIDLVFEIIENRLENQLDEVARSVCQYKQSSRKTSVFQQWQVSIYPTYPANFIKTTLQFNRHNSSNLKVHFLSEHAAVHWIILNNKSNITHLFVNSSNISAMNVSCPLSIQTVFKMSTIVSRVPAEFAGIFLLE